MRPPSAAKVLLEAVRVSRHVGSLGLRPLEKVARQAAHAADDLAFWAARLLPVEEVLGRRRAQQLEDAYVQVKRVAVESVSSLSHQSHMSVLQSCAEAATWCLRRAGSEARVVGPFDEHWRVLRVLGDLRATAQEREERRGHQAPALQFTPRRFVQFMRDAEMRKRRKLHRDPIEDYIEWMLKSGILSRMGPMFFEKKIYVDVAHIVCFAFDRTLMEANRTNIWGHQLRVKVAKEGGEAEVRPRYHSKVGVEQVEVLVDLMLKHSTVKAPIFMASIHRQLLMNCCLVILRVIEDLTSDRHMQLSLLGHTLRIQLDPIPLEQLLEAELSCVEAKHFQVNERAVDELVDALLEDTELQFLLVPDVLEAEVYRYVIHTIIGIAQFVLSRLRIRLFGLEVRLELQGDAPEPGQDAQDEDGASRELIVSQEDLKHLLERLEMERRQVERELRLRQGESQEEPLPQKQLGKSGPHPFQEMAALDQLSRSLAVQRTVPVPIDAAFQTIAQLREYPKWMPLCTGMRVTSEEENALHCELSMGVSAGPVLGMVAAKIRYRVSFAPPTLEAQPLGAGTSSTGGVMTARIFADTDEGFTYGKRLVYDWVLEEVAAGETDVRLNVFFQARRVIYLPIWDSMQTVISGLMMRRFEERATMLARGHKTAVLDPNVTPETAASETTGGTSGPSNVQG